MRNTTSIQLIGMTAERGTGYNRAGVLTDGATNAYAGPIPANDVKTRLFDTARAESVPLEMPVPADLETAEFLDANGMPVKRVPVPRWVAIRNADTHHVWTTALETRAIHQYSDWLIGGISNLIGDTLVISRAGLLDNGAKAWIEISLPETIHDTVSGVHFRANLIGGSAHDSSISTTYSRHVSIMECDNQAASRIVGEMGHRHKVKRTRHSGLRVVEGRSALSLINETANEYLDTLHTEIARTVNTRQFAAFLESWAPIADSDGKATVTRAERKRDELTAMYRHDDRVAPWQGTAFGVIQAVNTWQHHTAEIRGDVSRADRNIERALTGSINTLDSGTLATLDRVLATVG